MVSWLSPDDPPEAFPDLGGPGEDPEGLVAAGGDLTTARLIAAYQRGIFPWYEDGQPILWWSPDPRCVIYPRAVHIPRRLARTLRQKPFELTTDRCFTQVIDACAAPRRYTDGTWITAEMRRAYLQLHQQGHAHSVEAWQDRRLVGGIYGVVLGKVFFGESMFSLARDASKVVLISLAQALSTAGFYCLDCQLPSPHLFTLGAKLIPRTRFLAELEEHCPPNAEVPDWKTIFRSTWG
jgi:leucyl/phenylalanyl-tRNA--protein transferase